VDDEALATALAVARPAERLSDWRPRDWPDLAVELLLAGIDDLEIAELAGLPTSVTGWETDPLVASLYGKHGVPLPDPQEADAKAAQCRARPAEERAAHRNVLICRPQSGAAALTICPRAGTDLLCPLPNRRLTATVLRV
jgi:hypothetical protein